MRYALFFLFLSSAAYADDWRTAFYGTWGTPGQCAGELIKPGGSVAYEPFEIDEQWLRHGQLWCQLEWGPLERREDSLFTAATARCGEDSVSGYLLGMIQKDGDLTLRWRPFWVNGPLQRCPPS